MRQKEDITNNVCHYNRLPGHVPTRKFDINILLMNIFWNFLDRNNDMYKVEYKIFVDTNFSRR
jgi:hypothetical protein